MEAAQEQTTTATAYGGDTDYNDAPKDVTNFAKGKRTKRQRPQSPIRFTFSSSNNDLTSLSSSGFPTDNITAEDEDTAESLILLSKGLSLNLSTSRKAKEDYDGIFKFNSKKYIQSGEAGMYVYECKTCRRTFSSFQALGGHRASHKKPRNDEDMRKPLPYTAVVERNEPPPPPPECENLKPMNGHYYSPFYSISLQLNNRVSYTGNTMKASSRLHECSICGSEFNSGQALGGHMRRHRLANGRNKGGYSNATVNNINATTLPLVPFNPVTTMEVFDQKSNNDALRLGLDLNLPAPQSTTTTTAKDNQRQTRSFELSSAVEKEDKQQPAVHLSAAQTLVGCHY